ncbi:MAG TPA: hypothetical protein VMT47_02645 [Polyangia bacterium]|nr:hypothetical protein [Polyangia bacterium]
MPAQSASPAQARQVCVAPLQTGVAPAQSALAMHVTQVPLAASHAGREPPHRLLFIAEHAPHEPFG